MTDTEKALKLLRQGTPGPWTVSCVRLTAPPPIGKDTRLLAVGPEDDRLAMVYFDMITARGQADARAIAANPLLVEVFAAAVELDAAHANEARVYSPGYSMKLGEGAAAVARRKAASVALHSAIAKVTRGVLNNG